MAVTMTILFEVRGALIFFASNPFLSITQFSFPFSYTHTYTPFTFRIQIFFDLWNLFLQVDITQIKEGGPDWSINMDWWYPILFFVTCELMPILIMMLFQAR